MASEDLGGGEAVKLVVGIDPGKDGALVAIDLEGTVRRVELTKDEFTVPIGKGMLCMVFSWWSSRSSRLCRVKVARRCSASV